ncbi:site-specific integrase [Dongshaea marina]|uniref:site-specific integrase n=1 Tax=Dongshaea marina TaxID=2047966 RepID=UPI001F2C2F45|nr:site-specific integrase [Dongshaea marina]
MNFIADQATGNLSHWKWVDREKELGELTDGTPRKPSTLVRRLAGIRHALKKKGVFPLPTEHPEVKEMMRGIVRLGDTSVLKKDALTSQKLRQVLSQIDLSSSIGMRDYALLILMFYGALRRSEASRLDIEDLAFESRGIRMRIKPSKHQLVASEIAIIAGGSFCPVMAIRNYLQQARIFKGPLFRRASRWQTLSKARLGEQGINRIIKQHCREIFPDGDFSGHSLRRGFITSSVLAGKPLNKITEVSRHKDIRTLKEYFDEKEKFENHAASGLFD